MKVLKYIPLLLLTLPSAQAAYYNLAGNLQGPKLVFSPNPSATAINGQAFAVQPTVLVVKPNGTVITIGAAAAASITLSAYSDNRCTTLAAGSLSGTTTKAASAGLATFTGVAYAGTGTNTIFLKAKADGIASTCSAAVLASPDLGLPAWTPPPFRLVLSGPASLPTTTCTAYSIYLQDQYGGSAAASSALTINLSGIGTGAFYGTSDCSSSPITSKNIALGENKTTVYYKGPNAETNVLEAADSTGLISSGSTAVTLFATKLVFTAGPHTVFQGVCQAFTINHLNSSNDTQAPPISVNIDGYQAGSGAGASAIYTNSGCTTGIITGTGPITVDGPTPFYFKAPDIFTNLALTATSANVATGTWLVGIGTATPDRVGLSGSLSPIVDRCTAYTVSTQSVGPVNQPIASDRVITLTENGPTAQLYSDRQCKIPVTEVTIPAGTSQFTFYMKATATESFNLTATPAAGTPTLSSASITPTVVTSGITPIISSGTSHTCMLLADKTVKCWGYNFYGQLGDGTKLNSAVPVAVLGLTNVIGIASGSNHTCATLSVAPWVKCWGYNFYGQLGNNTNSDSSIPVTASGFSAAVTAITAGSNHTCVALSANPWAKCWGYNGSGQLGDNSTTNAYIPANVSGLSGISSISAGGNNTCALLSNQSVQCWGINSFGQIGLATSPVKVPTNISGISTATAVSTGEGHVCALLSNQTVQCWGYNFYGQLGDNSNTNNNAPQTALVSAGVPLSSVTAIATSSMHTCALISGTPTTMKCWGKNTSRQLGDASNTTSQNKAVTVLNLTGATAINAGGDHSCALFSDQTAKCWGKNTTSQLGNGLFNNYSTTPINATGLTNVETIATGQHHNCVLSADKKVWCWGTSTVGQLGNAVASSASSASPVQVTGLTNPTAITAGALHNCVLNSIGATSTTQCWGGNTLGQLGNGNTTDSNTPVEITSIPTAIAISSNGAHTCALLTDKTIKCWGSNSHGQIGTATHPVTAPVTVTGVSNNVTAVATGSYHTCALLTDQTVQCWGDNSNGQLGNTGAGSGSPSPVTVTGLNGVVAISAGQLHTCALLSSQTIKCWGSNLQGQLGAANNFKTSNITTPVVVVGITSAIAINTKAAHSCALLADKSVKCWGYNDFGGLGNGTITNSYLPSKVVGLMASNMVAASTYHSCAILSDKTVKCWGYNTALQLGINSGIPNFVVNIPE